MMKNDKIHNDILIIENPITHTNLAQRICAISTLSFALDTAFCFLGYLSVLALSWSEWVENALYLKKQCRSQDEHSASMFFRGTSVLGMA